MLKETHYKASSVRKRDINLCFELRVRIEKIMFFNISQPKHHLLTTFVKADGQENIYNFKLKNLFIDLILCVCRQSTAYQLYTL